MLLLRDFLFNFSPAVALLCDPTKAPMSAVMFSLSIDPPCSADGKCAIDLRDLGLVAGNVSFREDILLILPGLG